MHQKLAIIDLGTNTFHLLIAQRIGENYSVVFRDRVAVKIGVGGINRDIIPEEGIARALPVLKTFRNIIDQHAVAKVFAFGTSAFRNARNCVEVVKKIKQEANIDVNVISGDEEANFIYKGVRSAVTLGEDRALIMDIGGGSVEFIIANQYQVFWKKSIEIGAQRLLEKFQKHDPIAPEEILALDQYFKTSLAELLLILPVHNPMILVGSSGTFDTLSDIYCIQESISKTDDDKETPLTIFSFYSIYKELISKNRSERLLIPGMIDMRVDMIVVACCMIRFLLGIHPFNAIRVSTFALKEGVLAELIEKESEWL